MLTPKRPARRPLEIKSLLPNPKRVIPIGESPHRNKIKKVMRNILFPFIGSNMGGSHVSAFLLAAALQSRYSDRIVVICPRDTLISDVATQAGFEVVPTDDPAAERHAPAYDLSKTLSRLRLIRNFSPRNTIFHVNDIRAMQSWLLPAKLRRMPILYHNRSLNPFGPLKRQFVSLADHFVSISDICARNMSFLRPDRCETITNPFKSPENEPASVGPSGTPVIGFVSNFWERKRPKFFIDTIRHLNIAHPDARYAIFGRDGDLRLDELESYAVQAGVRDLIDFQGFKLSIDQNIASMVALAVPALDEPFGRTLVESILAGTPYVATASGGHEEICRRWRGGVLLPIEATPEDFSKALSKVIHDPQAIRLNSVEIRKIGEDISAEIHADQMSRIYERMLGAENRKHVIPSRAAAH